MKSLKQFKMIYTYKNILLHALKHLVYKTSLLLLEDNFCDTNGYSHILLFYSINSHILWMWLHYSNDDRWQADEWLQSFLIEASISRPTETLLSLKRFLCLPTKLLAPPWHLMETSGNNRGCTLLFLAPLTPSQCLYGPSHRRKQGMEDEVAIIPHPDLQGVAHFSRLK